MAEIDRPKMATTDEPGLRVRWWFVALSAVIAVLLAVGGPLLSVFVWAWALILIVAIILFVGLVCVVLFVKGSGRVIFPALFK